MHWAGLVVAGVLATLMLRRALRQRADRQEKRAQFRAELANIRRAVEEFEQCADFHEQIRILADLNRYCSKGFRLFPDQPDIMNLTRFSDDERRKPTPHWGVAESERLVKFVGDGTTL